MGMKDRIGKWMMDRFGAGPVWRNVLRRRVARGKWYFGDGATLTVLLAILMLTGALMTLTYSSDVDSAHASVEYLTGTQVLGWFIRGLHYWSAGLMVVMLFFHLFRQILLGGYKAPREGTWLIGVLLFFAVLFMSFSGYLLRWDERSVAAIQVALHMFYNVPVIGEWLVVLVQGGREIGPLTLTRIYGLHVVIVPMLLLGLVAYHVYLVIDKGTTSPSEQEQDVHSAEEQRKLYHRDAESDDRGEYFYPETVGSSGLMAFAFVGLAIVLTLALGAPEILPEARPHVMSQPTEEWWFWWYSSLIALLPDFIAPGFVVVFPLVVFLALVLLPFLDRGPRRGMRRRPFAVTAVVLMVAALLVLSSMRRESKWTAWPLEDPPPLPPGVQLSEEAEAGRILFARNGCNSCHSVGGHGREVAIDLARLEPPRSREYLEAYIRQPPQGVAMPSYTHLPQEEIEHLAEYVLSAQTFPGKY